MAGGRRAVLLLWCAALAGGQDVLIGVVDAPERAQQLAAAVEAARGDALVRRSGVQLSVAVRAEPGEALAAARHVCELAGEGAAAVLAGGGARLAGEGAARAGLPLLLVDETRADAGWEALTLHPHADVLAQVCADLCEAKAWREAVLLHEGSARGAALIAPDASRLTLVARQLPPDDGDLRNQLLLLKKSGPTNFIVWCGAACCARVLDAAQRVGLLADRHAYIALTTELHTRARADYSHGGANLTSLQLFDPDEVRDVMAAWSEAYVRRLGAGAAEEAAAVAAAPPAALLLAYDAARLVAAAAARLPLPREAAPAACELGRGAFHAGTLLNYLRSEEWNSSVCLSGGGAAWEADGARRQVQLRVVELERHGALRRVALWTPRAGLQWDSRDRGAAPVARAADSMTNRTFTVIIAMNAPYVMRKESTDRLSGNDRYEGFCIELIDRLAQQLHFNYTFLEQPDGAYGSLNNNTQQWDGMMGRLMRDPSIDFAITDLTITAEREKAVDFTTPFMNLGISILFRKPTAPEPELFAFLLPFSKDVWLCLGFGYLLTSLLLYVVGRLCPDEWQNPYPCIDDPPALENQFTLCNAFWFNLGAVLLQGSEIAPVAYGTRAVASVWWLFALVITSSYTANLASLLAKKSSNEKIHNVHDLANNDLGIKYGAKISGSTYTFFEHSQNELYQRMFEHMKQNEMPGNNDEGIKWVMERDFAFLMESTTIEYTTQRNCEVDMVGSLLDSKGYGIAMKKNSTYRQQLNLALLNLQEAGILREMKNTWWNEKHGGGACKEADERENERLQMPNFLGLFLVLVVGSVLGLVVSFADLALAAARRPRDPTQSFARRFWEELRFVFRFDQSEKPLQGPLRSPSAGSPARSESRPWEREDTTPEEPRLRSRSPESGGANGAGGPRPRRRSSMHAASARLARHAHLPRLSTSPSQQRE